MGREQELKAEFERGRRQGQLEGFPFKDGLRPLGPWLPGAEFEFEVSWFDSFIEYERQVMRNLRQLQRLRWLDRKHGQESVAPAELERTEEAIRTELRAVRRAVDAQLEEGNGRPQTVAAMRASPQRPNGVVEYRDLTSFVAENRRRGVIDWPQREDAAGADFGHYWQLENPFRRWETTSWRISWLCSEFAKKEPTLEVYALEFIERGGRRSRGRVWLLGELPTWQATEAALADLQLQAMRERNSLIVAAEAVTREAANQNDGPLAGGLDEERSAA